MPRQNQPRAMGREDVLAEKVATLRQAAVPPMSYETLASRMEAVGCPIQPSALHRIEKGTPRRKVTVDELVAFAQVFDVSIEDLIALPESDLGRQTESALRSYRQALLWWQTAEERLAASATEADQAKREVVTRHGALVGLRRQLGSVVHGLEVTVAAPQDVRALLMLRDEVDQALRIQIRTAGLTTSIETAPEGP